MTARLKSVLALTALAGLMSGGQAT
ncbi:MAG: hypothetical protein JWM33_3350, partial [Caulobacteraceae bacterium]|nr:hypothetical protein [Caulobacteraceae bacterium]